MSGRWGEARGEVEDRVLDHLLLRASACRAPAGHDAGAIAGIIGAGIRGVVRTARGVNVGIEDATTRRGAGVEGSVEREDLRAARLQGPAVGGDPGLGARVGRGYQRVVAAVVDRDRPVGEGSCVGEPAEEGLSLGGRSSSGSRRSDRCRCWCRSSSWPAGVDHRAEGTRVEPCVLEVSGKDPAAVLHVREEDLLARSREVRGLRPFATEHDDVVRSDVGALVPEPGADLPVAPWSAAPPTPPAPAV